MGTQNKPKTTRGEKSRRKILQNTWDLIGKADSRSVTLDQIADASGVSKSSILWYFGSKEALLLEVADNIFRDLEKAFVEQCPTDLPPSSRFDFFLSNYEDMLNAAPEAPRIFFSFLFNSQFRNKISKKIREIYEWNRKSFCEQFGLTENQAVLLLGTLNGIVIQANIHPDQINIKDIFDEFRSLVKKIL